MIGAGAVLRGGRRRQWARGKGDAYRVLEVPSDRDGEDHLCGRRPGANPDSMRLRGTSVSATLWRAAWLARVDAPLTAILVRRAPTQPRWRQEPFWLQPVPDGGGRFVGNQSGGYCARRRRISDAEISAG